MQDTSWLDVYLSDVPHVVYQVADPNVTQGAQHATLAGKGREAMGYLQVCSCSKAPAVSAPAPAYFRLADAGTACKAAQSRTICSAFDHLLERCECGSPPLCTSAGLLQLMPMRCVQFIIDYYDRLPASIAFIHGFR